MWRFENFKIQQAGILKKNVEKFPENQALKGKDLIY
jgi:hypothetical protein